MFERQEMTPWYRSRTTFALGALCLAMAGLALLYYVWGYRFFSKNETHYTELERHRAQQRQENMAAPTPEDQSTPAQPAAPTPANQANAEVITQQPAVASTPVNSTVAVAPPAAPRSEASHAIPKVSRNYWTNYRGPERDGRYDERAIKTNWPAAGLTPMWKQPVGGGYASFVVADGVAYTIEQRRRQEVVAAYNVENGKELWTHGWNAEFIESQGGDGPRATPTWDEGRLYALGAEGELRCLDAKTGKPIWNRNILSDNGAENLDWGMAASPLIVDDKVVVLPGGTSGKSVVAYNKLTGAPVWKVLNDRQAYTSPMLVTLAGKRQILVVSANRIVGLAPENGALLWSHPWATQYGINVSQPIVVSPNRFFISAGYGHGSALVEVSGSGKSFTARTVWENTSMKAKFNSPVVHNGYAYGLDEGILTCVDLATGERKWKGGRYGYGQVLLASGHLIVTTENGEIVLVKADPTAHKEVTRFAALEGRTWNVPALAGGRLLVRNATHMACYNLAE